MKAHTSPLGKSDCLCLKEKKSAGNDQIPTRSYVGMGRYWAFHPCFYQDKFLGLNFWVTHLNFFSRCLLSSLLNWIHWTAPKTEHPSWWWWCRQWRPEEIRFCSSCRLSICHHFLLPRPFSLSLSLRVSLAISLLVSLSLYLSLSLFLSRMMSHYVSVAIS